MWVTPFAMSSFFATWSPTLTIGFFSSIGLALREKKRLRHLFSYNFV